MEVCFKSDPAVVKWLACYEPGERGRIYLLHNWHVWMQGRDGFGGLSPSELVEWQRRARKEDREYELLDLVQEYIRGLEGTAKSLQTRYAVIRAFFRKNRAPLPDDDFRFHPSKPPNQGKLTVQIVRSLVENCGGELRPFYLTLWMGLMDQERFSLFSKGCAAELVKHLKEKGVDQLFMFTYPGRKGLKGKKNFHTYIGHDALVAWQEYFERIRGWPKDGEAIYLDKRGKSANKATLYVRHTRMLERLHYIKCGGSPSNRYGLNLHEFRDTSRTLLHLEGKAEGLDQECVEFWMGHTTDPNQYDKFYTDKEYTLKQYRIAEKHLNIISRIQVDKSNEKEVKRLRQDLEQRDLIVMEAVQRLRNLEQVVAQLSAKGDLPSRAVQARVHPSEA